MNERFDPNEALDKISSMFQMQASWITDNAKLDFVIVSNTVSNSIIENDFQNCSLPKHLLPKQLFGDKTRFNLVLVNILRCFTKICIDGYVKVVVAYDEA